MPWRTPPCCSRLPNCHRRRVIPDGRGDSSVGDGAGGSSSTTTRPHRCPTRSSRPNLSASRLVHDARRLRPRQVAAAQPAWSVALSGSGSSCRCRCARSNGAATKPDEATRATTRWPDCFVAMACCARLCGGRCGGDPSMACKGSDKGVCRPVGRAVGYGPGKQASTLGRAHGGQVRATRP
jgi:hypothetical protein